MACSLFSQDMNTWIMILLSRWLETINSRRFLPDSRVLCPQLMRPNWSLTCCGRLTRYAVNDHDDWWSDDVNTPLDSTLMTSSLWWSSPPSSLARPPGRSSLAPSPRLRRSLRSTWRWWTRLTKRRRRSSTSSPEERSWQSRPRPPSSWGRSSPPWRSCGMTPTTSPSRGLMTWRWEVFVILGEILFFKWNILSDKYWLLECICREVCPAPDSHYNCSETNWRC